ncbi:MAG TPA: MtnX-like HAD-IB family phosphatase [Tissierellales bacterium]|nr:MtnX-like HAD-IB family phosphatase [Tissierellales bacterium]
MIKINDLSSIVILSDFDGTITTEDTNAKLIKYFGNETTRERYNQYKKGKIHLLSYLELQYRDIGINEEEYTNFILNKIEISRGFKEFFQKVKRNNIPFAIISGGFENGIIPFLRKHGINDIDIYANSINFGDEVTLDYYHKASNCCKLGPCGNCKIKHYENYKEKDNTVIFIGDGVTDKPVAEVADMVFAKDSLLDYCKDNDIDCIPWEDFRDINKIIFGKGR